MTLLVKMVSIPLIISLVIQLVEAKMEIMTRKLNRLEVVVCKCILEKEYCCKVSKNYECKS